MSKKIQTVILGASGYTGAELLRLAVHHPHIELVALTGDSQAGKHIGEVYPSLSDIDLTLVKHDTVDYESVDLVFCCLPHGTTQKIIAALPTHLKVIDLSADFRLSNLDAYEKWYGHAHQAEELQGEAVYGLTEHYADDVSKARLVACPGCYPTSILLPLLPLAKTGLIDTKTVIVDALTGVTGAGRKTAQGFLYSEVNEGAKAYGVGAHRHTAELEQELGKASGENVIISFTPHLVPMSRGISATIHVDLKDDAIVDVLKKNLIDFYADKPFVQVVDGIPSTHEVRGTNLCRIGVASDRQEGRAIIVSVIDNLTKGSSGQAIQNMNLMFGLPEVTGLELRAVFP